MWSFDAIKNPRQKAGLFLLSILPLTTRTAFASAIMFR
jgi:hypothetical protein